MAHILHNSLVQAAIIFTVLAVLWNVTQKGARS